MINEIIDADVLIDDQKVIAGKFIDPAIPSSVVLLIIAYFNVNSG